MNLEQLSYLPELSCNESPRELLVQEALKYGGYPSLRYRRPETGMSPIEGFDCSGLVTFLLDELKIDRSGARHCNEYFDYFGVQVQLGMQRRGDLVFFSRTGNQPTHVGIMITPNVYIHSPGRNNRFVGIEPLRVKELKSRKPLGIYTHNPIGFKRIAEASGRWRRWV